MESYLLHGEILNLCRLNELRLRLSAKCIPIQVNRASDLGAGETLEKYLGECQRLLGSRAHTPR